MPTARLLPLFLACFASIGFEIRARQFSPCRSWSEYGYWVISLPCWGGERRRGGTRGAPAVAARPDRAGAATCPGDGRGDHRLALDDRGAVQSARAAEPALWEGQFANIAQLYSPSSWFFFRSASSPLVFVVNARRIGRVYAADLAGAGSVPWPLALMFVMPPFDLVAGLLPALALAAAGSLGAPGAPSLEPSPHCSSSWFARASLVLANQARVSKVQDIFAPLSTSGSQVVAEIRSPRGSYQAGRQLRRATETDLSNNAGRFGVKGLHAPTATGTAIIAAAAARGRAGHRLLRRDAGIAALSGCGRARPHAAAGRPPAHPRGTGARRQRLDGRNRRADTGAAQCADRGLGPVDPINRGSGTARARHPARWRFSGLGTQRRVRRDRYPEFLAQSDTPPTGPLSAETLPSSWAC